jgi:hypothetical protein
MTQIHSFKLFADYHQFYIQDETSAGDLSDAWTPEAVDRLLALAPGIVGVGTVRNMFVPVDVAILTRPPADDLDPWDRVNECSVEFTSGRAVIAGCTDYLPDAARIDVAPGLYRARIYYGALDSVSDDGLDGRDHYRIALWPGGQGPLLQLKVPRVA